MKNEPSPEELPHREPARARKRGLNGWDIYILLILAGTLVTHLDAPPGELLLFLVGNLILYMFLAHLVIFVYRAFARVYHTFAYLFSLVLRAFQRKRTPEDTAHPPE